MPPARRAEKAEGGLKPDVMTYSFERIYPLSYGGMRFVFPPLYADFSSESGFCAAVESVEGVARNAFHGSTAPKLREVYPVMLLFCVLSQATA
jgi:hypothetical protein